MDPTSTNYWHRTNFSARKFHSILPDIAGYVSSFLVLHQTRRRIRF